MANEDADVMKIRRFVTKSLESVGALVDFRGYNFAEVLIPDEYMDYFGGESYFSISFDYDVAKQHEDSELVTYGSYFLDRVIDLASRIGITCKQHIVDENLELRGLSEKIRGKIAFRDCRATFVASAPIIYHYVVFNFKVSYISDERVDTIVKVLVNLNTGHVDSEMLKAIGTAFFTDSSHTNYTVEQMRSIDDAYRAATEALEEQIQPMIHELSVNIRKRLNNEKERIMEYYDQADSELNTKREKLVESGRDEGLKSIDDKLHLSEVERQRRINEIEEKNALKVSVMLFSASLISHTKISSRYSLKRGKAERSIHVVWNPLLNNFEPLVCEICDSETTKIELCANSHLGCTNCVNSCSVCNVHLCKECGMTECSVCGVPLCGNCKIVCENCGDVLCEKHIEFCTCKEEKRRKAAERAEKKAREKLEAEEKKEEEHISKFRDIPLNLSKSELRYHESYVRKNVDALDEVWIDLIFEAQSLIAPEEHVKARAILQRLNAEYPPNAWVKARLVLSYKRINQDVSSMGTQATRLAQHMALAHFALGYIYEKTGKSQSAINSYEQAVKLSGNEETYLRANALFRMGEIFYDQRNFYAAERRWNMALLAEPRFRPARQALEQLYR